VFSRVGRPRVGTETRGRVNIAQPVATPGANEWFSSRPSPPRVHPGSGPACRLSAHALRRQYLKPRHHIDKRFVLHIPRAGGDFVTGIGDVARCPASTEENSKRADDNELLGLSHRRTARRRASNKFAADSSLEGSGFES